MAGNFAETIQIDSTSFCKCAEDMSVQPKPTQKHPKASSYMMLQSARSRKTSQNYAFKRFSFILGPK